MHHVYTGNVHDRLGGTTVCPGCAKVLVERDWHRILRYELDDRGGCTSCGTAIAGRFGPFEQAFGARRIPVRLAMA